MTNSRRQSARSAVSGSTSVARRAGSRHAAIETSVSSDVITVNQQQKPAIDDHFVSLGNFEFAANQPAAVVVTNRGADGYVIIDAVQWLPSPR